MLITQRLIPKQLDIAAAILQQGGLVVFPTDTVYGVAALAQNEEAVSRIYAAKQRPPDMPLPVMIKEAKDVHSVARPLAGFWELTRVFWPGPLTIILPKTNALPAIVTAGGETVALRIPDHPLALDLLKMVGAPLAVTSANLSGRSPSRSADDVWLQLDGKVDAIVDGGKAPGGQPSTIVDLTQMPYHILRHGPITDAQIRTALTSIARQI